MRQLSTLALVLASGLVSSACSTGYDAELAELRQQYGVASEPQPSTQAEAEPQPAADVEPSAEAEPAGTAQASSQRDTTVGQKTNAKARANEFKPWPKRGTPEAKRLQAEEAKEEKRINEMIHNICQDC